MTKLLGCFLLSVLAAAGAEKISTREILELALQKPDSTEFHEALVASVREVDLKSGTAALSDHGQGLFAVESSGTPALFI
jgi:hypothetical protein